MPLNYNETAAVVTDGFSGEAYFALIIIVLTFLACLTIFYLIVRIWGKPILDLASTSISGDALVQHFQNSKVGSLLLAPIGGGAIRHKKVSDGTVITTPHGINNFHGHSFVNSWNLSGFSIPTFLMGGISKLRERGITTRDRLETLTTDDPEDTKKEVVNKYGNLIPEAYNFNDFKDILKKAANPSFINLQIEFVGDFIESINQHYTESEITKEVRSYTMKIKSRFASIMIITAIAIFIVAIADYILIGAV